MSLTHLSIKNFRNLTSVVLAPIDRFNIFYGENGSGKTSLIEAISYLSLGRSFRHTMAQRIVQHSAEALTIHGQISEDLVTTAVGLQRHVDGGLKLRVNGQPAPSIMTLAERLPVQLMDTHCHQLIDAGPIFRRKYLDWGAFYLQKDYLRIWKLYARALKQRNAALRGQIPRKELGHWTHELSKNALLLDQLRADYFAHLLPLLHEKLNELLVLPTLSLTYYRGWPESALSYNDQLERSLDKDLQYGHTQWGPHKADLKIKIKQLPAKDILSRGQQKMFVCAMILARGALLLNHTKQPIYLVDDLPSELDRTSRSRLITLLARQDTQVFITTTDPHHWHKDLDSVPMKMFHVEHGQVEEKIVVN